MRDLVNSKKGVAIRGYDPVAYFTMHQAVEGDPRYSHHWNGAVWHFASSEHRDLFVAEPEHYAPQYGGYCAWAMSKGSLAGINPKAWHIEDNRLFLNYNARLNRRFLKDLPTRIREADQNWPLVRERLSAAS
ncbi:MAG: YHS domain protein [Spirochaetaceae bacterium]|nr:MAG: YHS domain protein [Spirochaetaceae bacterium]